MSLLDLLKGAQGAPALESLGQSLGLDSGTTRSLAEQFAPAISGGVKRRAAQDGGMGAILGALKGTHGASYFDDATAAATEGAQADGARFLTEIFGSKDAAPQLAEAAAAKTGATTAQAQQLLPALAAMLQGGMQKQVPDAEIETALAGLGASGDKAGSGLGDLMGVLGGSGGAGQSGIMGTVMGMLGGGGARKGQADGLGSVLAMLDADGDGSPLDDVIGRFLK
ncbi:MAG: DUF937 domain-containing protein [Pseudomonadota bacterium]